MRVLAVHRYYWPDTPPYASLLRAIVRRWTDDGHDVEVVSTQPSYKPELALARRPARERVDGALVRRVALGSDRRGAARRVFNVLAFPVAVAWRILLGRRHDVVMCSTAPPVVLGVLVSLAARARGARFVYHCMDLHPEIGALSGEFANRHVRRVLAALDRGTCRRAAAVVVLSEDMRAALLERDPGLADRIVVLNNFDLPDFDGAASDVVDSPLPPSQGRVRIVFTGNLGRFQGLESVTDAVLGADPGLDRVELVHMGEGGAKDALRRRVEQAPADRRDRVRFLPHGTSSEARALMRTADLGLVSLAPEVVRYAYPSKTATYLSEGVPVLARVERDSELVDMLVRRGAGRHLPAGPADIRAVLLDLVDDAAGLEDMAHRASVAWQEEFGARTVLPRWSRLLDDVARGTPDPGGDPGRDGDGDGDVVIVGAPRSGTNMLRDILTSVPEFTTWDCDEINLTWRHGNRAAPHDELTPVDATAAVRDYLRGQFDRVRTSGSARVVEKTCANSLRVPFVHAVKPHAKYVFITRDGLDVVPSAMQRWHAPFDLGYTLEKVRYVPPTDLAYYGGRFALNQWRRRTSSESDEVVGSWWGPKPADWRELVRDRPLDEVCLVQWQRCVDRADEALAALPDEQVHRVRYEDFVAEPEVELRRLLDFLGATHDDLASLVTGVSSSSVGRGRDSLDDATRRRLVRLGGSTLERLGYAT